MRKLGFLAVLAILFTGPGLAAAQESGAASSDSGAERVFCAQDVRRCPDGSYVGRTGPKCEFAACSRSLNAEIPESKTGIKVPAPKTLPYERKNQQEWETIRSGQAEENKRGMEESAEGVIYRILPDGTQKQVDGSVPEEKNRIFDVITNSDKPIIDFRKQQEQSEADRVRQAEENRRGMENVRNIPVFEALPAEAVARIKAVREEIMERKEEAKRIFEEKKEELKERVEAISDEKKQEIVVRLNDNINDLNKKKTEDFSAVIVKLERIWAAIVSKAGQAAERGISADFVSEADSRISGLFEAAKTSLSSQAGQVYDLALTTEDNLRTDISQVRQELHTDLRTVQESIVAVKEALREVGVQLNQALAPAGE